MVNYKVRKATLDDVKSMSIALSESYRDTHSSYRPIEDVERTIERNYTVDALRKTFEDEHWNGYYIAVQDCGLVLGAGGAAFQPPESSQLYVIYVHPEHRYKGIGRRLLASITEEVMAQGAKEMWVSVEPQNMKGIPFYEARGFALKETRGAYAGTDENGKPIFDEAHQMLRFCREIGQGV
ncbi:MAG: N-acetyltransferase [Chloroflexota bacterium]